MTKRGLTVAIVFTVLGLLLIGASFYELDRVFGFDVRNLPSERWRVPIMLLLGTPFAAGICMGSAVTLVVQARRRAAGDTRDTDADERARGLSAGASGEPMETLER